MNIQERVEQRRMNYMKHPEDQIDRRETFQINLRKEKRKEFVKSCRTSLEKSKDTIMNECPQAASIIIKMINNLRFSVSEAELSERLESINEVFSESIFETLLKSPELILNILNFLNHSSDQVSFKTAKILSKLLSSKKENKSKILEIFPLSCLLSMIKESKLQTSKYLIRCLSHLANDSPHFCMILTQEKAHVVVFNLLKQINEKEIFYEISVFYLKLANKFKEMKLQVFEEISLGLKYLIQNEEVKLLNTVLGTLNILLPSNPNRVRQFMFLHITDRIITLVSCTEQSICEQALKVIGDCSIGDIPQINMLLEHGLLNLLLRTTKQGIEFIRQESFYIISNIIASGACIIDVIINHQVCLNIIESLTDQNLKVLKEVSFVYFNLSVLANWKQLEYLALQGVLNCMKTALAVNSSDISINFLRFCHKLLLNARDHKAFEVFDMFHDSGCFDMVERKCKDMNLEIYNIVSKILNFFISDERNSLEAMEHETPLEIPASFAI